MYIVGPTGKIGVACVGWWTKLTWRFNTVVIRNIKNWDGEDVFVVIALSALLFGVITGAYCLIRTTIASGKIESCYVQTDERESNATNGNVYVVKGYKSWRSDDVLLKTRSYDEAVTKMHETCPK